MESIAQGSPLSAEPMQLPKVVIDRCRDPRVIHQLLKYQFYDLPVCRFSERLLLRAANWLAKNESIYFLTAEVSSEVAGYAFVHTYGPMLWREFGFSSIGAFLSTTVVYLRTRLLPASWQAPMRSKSAAPVLERQKLATLQIEHSQLPFAWSRPDGATAYVEMLHVKPGFRGQRLAQQLLRRVAHEIHSDSIRRTEAHVDAGNYASVRAFLGADWQMIERKDGDFYAYVNTT